VLWVQSSPTQTVICPTQHLKLQGRQITAHSVVTVRRFAGKSLHGVLQDHQLVAPRHDLVTTREPDPRSVRSDTGGKR
jgi:hypothetical protein